MGDITDADGAVLVELGGRLARRRLDLGLTQAQLAREAGIGTSTVERMESGRSTQLSSFIRVARVLGLLDDLVAAIPAPTVRPMELLKLKSGERQRARRREDQAPPTWRWEDDA